jgi:hypothetical protein
VDRVGLVPFDRRTQLPKKRAGDVVVNGSQGASVYDGECSHGRSVKPLVAELVRESEVADERDQKYLQIIVPFDANDVWPSAGIFSETLEKRLPLGGDRVA